MKKYLIVMCVVLGLLLNGCVSLNDKGYMYDNDELIVDEGDSFTYRSKVGTYEDLDFEDFSGTETVLSIEDIDVLYVNIDFTIDKGKFKIVFIDQDNEIIILDKGEHEVVLDGEFARIKLVGAHAYGHFNISFDELINTD
ncbi:hypothetical protein BK010_09550 [Tenericutes bacterium MO-XQ]|nr:hypothetical protein BK010_09550 [Tenericutes bacterium MO-XQ]